jgi:hypothetical protein
MPGNATFHPQKPERIAQKAKISPKPSFLVAI